MFSAPGLPTRCPFRRGCTALRFSAPPPPGHEASPDTPPLLGGIPDPRTRSRSLCSRSLRHGPSAGAYQLSVNPHFVACGPPLPCSSERAPRPSGRNLQTCRRMGPTADLPSQHLHFTRTGAHATIPTGPHCVPAPRTVLRTWSTPVSAVHTGKNKTTWGTAWGACGLGRTGKEQFVCVCFLLSEKAVGDRMGDSVCSWFLCTKRNSWHARTQRSPVLWFATRGPRQAHSWASRPCRAHCFEG